MFAKPISFALLGFVFIQIMNVARTDESSTVSVAGTTEDICSLPDDLEPFLPWANALAKQLNDSANDAVLLKQQLIEGCDGLKANNFPKEDKEGLADRIRSFSANSDNILGQMADMLGGGGDIVRRFKDVADELCALAEEEN